MALYTIRSVSNQPKIEFKIRNLEPEDIEKVMNGLRNRGTVARDGLSARMFEVSLKDLQKFWHLSLINL